MSKTPRSTILALTLIVLVVLAAVGLLFLYQNLMRQQVSVNVAAVNLHYQDTIVVNGIIGPTMNFDKSILWL